jgi:hypothetical protein
LLAVVFALLPVETTRGVIRDGGIDPANLGQGGWLYLLNNATNHLAPNNIAAVTNENSLFQYLKGQGLRYVIVKAGTSDQIYYDPNYSTTSPVFTSSLVNLAHSNGLKIFGSNRSWGSNIVGEINVANYVFNQGADGFIFDAESEWEASVSRPWITNAPAQAWWLCGTVRSNWPTKFIAHNPYDTLYLHSVFPYKEFGYWCDAVMPQVYHHSQSQGNAFAAIHWMDVNYKVFQNSLASLPVGNSNGLIVYWTNAIKPLTLMRDVYGTNFTTKHPAVDVRNFMDYLVADPNCVTAGGYKGSDYFRSELHDLGQWAHIKASTIGIFPGVVNNIVMDDARIGRVGSWTAVKTIDATTGNSVTFSGEFGTDTNSFGTNYFKATQGSGARYLQFTPAILTGGDYLCYQWHPVRADASASVPHIIAYNAGSTTVYANQQTNPGNWSLLGQFNFAPGTAGYVRITDAIPESGGVAMVDGLKLVFVPPTAVPAVPSGLSATAVSSNQINLAWTDNATNEVSYIVARSGTAGGPYTDLAVLPRNATAYTNTGLTIDTTYYYVVWATNYMGASPTSPETNATTIGVPPAITSQPPDRTVSQGADVTFSVIATGTPPLSYQWRLYETNLPGATGSDYSLTNVQPADAGPYSVQVTNSGGTTTSSNAQLTVVTPINVIIWPMSQTVTQGTSASFNAAVNGGLPPFDYQWRFNGTNIAAATTTTCTISNAQPSDEGSYSVIVSNTYGYALSPDATLFVLVPPSITAQPQSQEIAHGSNVTFTVTADGTLPLGYQWRFNGTNLADATASACTVTNAQAKDAGSYSVVVSNIAGTLTSTDAVLTVTTPLPPHIDSISLMPDGQLQVQVSGAPGRYAMDASTNLADWAELTNFTTTSDTFQYLDADTNQLQRFYRVRLMP